MFIKYFYIKFYLLIYKVDCLRCKIVNGNGYMEDSCDCQYYYQCQKIEEGHFIAHKRKCPDCQMWNPEILACILDPTQTCSTLPTPSTTPIGSTTEYVCIYKAYGPNRSKYIQNGKVVDCPPGSLYNQTNCGCTDRAREPGYSLLCRLFIVM